MKKKIIKYLPHLLAICLIGYLIYFIIGIFLVVDMAIQTESHKKKMQEEKAKFIQVHLIVENIINDVVEIKKGATVLDILKKDSSPIHEAKFYQENGRTVVTEINTNKADISNNQHWIFYINGNRVAEDIASYVINDNDTIEWKRESLDKSRFLQTFYTLKLNL